MKTKFHHFFYCIFFFWLAGVEQFIITPFYLFITYFKNKKFKISTITFPICAIIIFMIFSIVNISDTTKLFQLLRNIYSYVGALLVLSYHYFHSSKIYNSHYDFLKLIYFSSFIICFFGFLPILGINISYESPLYKFASNDFLKIFFYKTFADPNSGLFFMEGFVRPKGLMLFPNELSQIVVINLVIGLYLKDIKKLSPYIFMVFFLVCLIVLVSTLSRGSWIALFCSLIVAQTIQSIMKKTISFNLIFSILGLIIVAYFFNFFDLIISRFEGGHSNAGRISNYMNSITMTFGSLWTIFFGHGSQLDFYNYQSTLKLGSHSTYIGLLFKYGIFAFSSYVLFQIMLLKKIFSSFNQKIINERKFILYTQIIVISIVHSIFYDLDVDMNVMLFYFAMFGFIASQTNENQIIT